MRSIFRSVLIAIAVLVGFSLGLCVEAQTLEGKRVTSLADLVREGTLVPLSEGEQGEIRARHQSLHKEPAGRITARDGRAQGYVPSAAPMPNTFLARLEQNGIWCLRVGGRNLRPGTMVVESYLAKLDGGSRYDISVYTAPSGFGTNQGFLVEEVGRYAGFSSAGYITYTLTYYEEGGGVYSVSTTWYAALGYDPWSIAWLSGAYTQGRTVRVRPFYPLGEEVTALVDWWDTPEVRQTRDGWLEMELSPMTRPGTIPVTICGYNRCESIYVVVTANNFR